MQVILFEQQGPFLFPQENKTMLLFFPWGCRDFSRDLDLPFSSYHYLVSLSLPTSTKLASKYCLYFCSTILAILLFDRARICMSYPVASFCLHRIDFTRCTTCLLHSPEPYRVGYIGSARAFYDTFWSILTSFPPLIFFPFSQVPPRRSGGSSLRRRLPSPAWRHTVPTRRVSSCRAVDLVRLRRQNMTIRHSLGVRTPLIVAATMTTRTPGSPFRPPRGKSSQTQGVAGRRA